MYKSRRKEAFLFDEQAIVPIKNRFWLDLSRFSSPRLQKWVGRQYSKSVTLTAAFLDI